MSMSRTALKLVQKSLPQLRLCESKLVLPPTRHIVRGFMLERTPYKGCFYLWRLVMPLFRMTMNYSTRVGPRADHIHLSKENPVESAAVVAKIVSENIPYLESVQTPRDFLDHISWMIGNDSPNFLFDLAVTYFLVGRYHEALLALRETSMEAERTASGFRRAGSPDSPVIAVMDQLRRTADDFAVAVRSNPSAAAEIVSGWERANVERSDLADTLLEATPGPSVAAWQRDTSGKTVRAHMPPPPQPAHRNPSRTRRPK